MKSSEIKKKKDFEYEDCKKKLHQIRQNIQKLNQKLHIEIQKVAY
tara:strand:+ start:297 stop:431 length:135 start_codon:yes stop_codon:yes gene_type:complete